MGTTPDFPLIGPPRISTLGFTEVLRSNRSPAAPEALYAYRAALDQGVDPAVLLAVFRKESTFGRFGKANRNRSWGNIRDPQTGAFRAYESWADGARDAARLLAVYGRNQIRPGRNTSTVQTMPYVWAPAADGNGPDRYGDQLARWISEWQRKYPASGSGAGLPPPAGVPTSTPTPPPTEPGGRVLSIVGGQLTGSCAQVTILAPNNVQTRVMPIPRSLIGDPCVRCPAGWNRAIADPGPIRRFLPGPFGILRGEWVNPEDVPGQANACAAPGVKPGDSFDADQATDAAGEVAGAAFEGLARAIIEGGAPLIVNGALVVALVGLAWAGLRDLTGGSSAS